MENAQVRVEPVGEVVQRVLQQQRVSRVGQQMQVHWVEGEQLQLLLLPGSRQELSWSHGQTFKTSSSIYTLWKCNNCAFLL